jgi:hypothetical protein
MLRRVSVKIGQYSFGRAAIELDSVLTSESFIEDSFPRLVESKAVVFNFSTEIRESCF